MSVFRAKVTFLASETCKQKLTENGRVHLVTLLAQVLKVQI